MDFGFYKLHLPAETFQYLATMHGQEQHFWKQTRLSIVIFKKARRQGQIQKRFECFLRAATSHIRQDIENFVAKKQRLLTDVAPALEIKL
jgi:hypothetical protein